MRLRVLVDDTASKRELRGEHGLSLYIEDGETKVLFDSGESSLFAENADRLGIDLMTIDYMVLSHGHYDHSWGLKYLLNMHNRRHKKSERLPPIFLAHPLVFIKRKKFGLNIGCDVVCEQVATVFDVRLSREPVWLTERLVFLGEIKRDNDFEGKTPVGKTKAYQDVCGDITQTSNWQPDFILDDTALVYKSPQGLVVISGCSHAGICNICEQARRIASDNRIHAIIGGLHLRQPEETHLNGTIEYLRLNNIADVYAGHCTDLLSKVALAKTGVLQEMTTGMQLEWKE